MHIGKFLCLFLNAIIFLSSACVVRDTAARDSGESSAPTSLYAWTELGPDGALIARVVASGDVCPEIRTDRETLAMRPRAVTRPEGFDMNVCECEIPFSVKEARVNGQALALLKEKPKRVVVLGDTGCRIKNEDVQNCNGRGSGPAWRFAEVAAAAAAAKPDLVIHVGDYLYRETPCPEGNAGCEGSPYGDNWETWQTDFFHPAGSLLSGAPWAFVRGNHENCDRSWKGWFFLLDPNPLAKEGLADCVNHPPPYGLEFGDQTLIVLDTSKIPDDYSQTPDSGAVAVYAGELNMVNDLASRTENAWLATHRPFWAISSYVDSNGNTASSTMDATLRAALGQTRLKGFAESVSLLFGGHIHQFEDLDFDDGRPRQFVTGAGGTKLDPPLTTAYLQAHEELFTDLGIRMDQYHSIHDFNFLLLEAVEGGWLASVRDVNGKVKAEYAIP